MSQTGTLIVLTGPTASGKDAVMHKLLEQNPTWSRIITTTTRSPRIGEIDGKDYFFIDKEIFTNMQHQEKFLETVEYSGNYYGTTKYEIEKVLNGQTLIWRIEPTMAAKITEYFQQVFSPEIAKTLLDHTKIFYIKVPSKETLVNRLAKRGMSDGDIEKRFQQDEQNWENLKDKFEQVIVNEDGKLDETVKEISEIIQRA